jgi:outer membrane receptor protein involved in Fe transport
VEALDLVFKYRLSWAARREFNASVRLACTMSHLYDGVETVGRATVTNGTIPRWSGVTTLIYRHGNWRFTVLGRAIASVFADLEGFDTGGYGTYNAGVSYQFGEHSPAVFRNLDVSLTVKNVSDASPRLAPITFAFANADIGTYNPLGRTWLLSTNYRF